MREYYTLNPSAGWRWEEWGAATDTRWYLDKFGRGSLGVGFGWKYQFHLHLGDPRRFDGTLINARLGNEKYAKIVIPFGVNPAFDSGSGSRVRANCFDFSFGSINDGNIPQNELAWYAAHKTEDFVNQAIEKIDYFIRDDEMTRLITELNTEADRLGVKGESK